MMSQMRLTSSDISANAPGVGARCYLENREIGLFHAALTPPPQNREGPLRRLISILYKHGGFFCPKILTSRHHLTPHSCAPGENRCSDQLLVHSSSTGES